jgi:hypothetical protein
MVGTVQAASSSTEFGAAVRFPDAIPTRTSAVRASAAAQSAAPLSCVRGDFEPPGRLAYLGEIDPHFETRNGGRDDFAALLALAIGVGAALHEGHSPRHGSSADKVLSSKFELIGIVDH